MSAAATTTRPAATAWQAGSFNGPAGRGRLLFGRMYEDPEIERAAFHGRRRVFCIASAGCTAIALSGQHDVVACDINPVQLAYAQRRIQGGPIEVGTAEQVMAFGRRLLPLAGWRQPQLQSFLEMSHPAGQLKFWHQQFDTRRFRLGFDTLLSPRWLRLVYAQPFLEFLPPAFGAVLRARLARGFARHPNATNPYVQALFLGRSTLPVPRPQSPIALIASDAASYLEACPPASFDGFTFSNILDGATPAYRQRLARAVRRAAAPHANVVLRSFAQPADVLTRNHAADDRALLWGVVSVTPANTFS